MARTKAGGFALVELAVSAVTLLVLICLLLVGAPASRGLAWQAGSLANLHEFAAVTGSYQADYNDLFWSFSWRTGVQTPSQYPDLQAPPTDPMRASAAQGVDLLRRRTGLPVPAGLIERWAANATSSHLVLADYLDQAPPLRFAVSPGDRHRLDWSNDIDGFLRGDYLPDQPDPANPNSLIYPFSSSYGYPAAFTSPDARSGGRATVISAGTYFQYTYSAGSHLWDIGGRLVTEVTFPSQKVMLCDMAQWQGARSPVYCLYPSARVPVLLVDGSAAVRVSGQANAGFRPDSPQWLFPTSIFYDPAGGPYPWDPPQQQPGVSNLIGRYLWTRGGLRGRDFDGQETDTSDWQ